VGAAQANRATLVTQEVQDGEPIPITAALDRVFSNGWYQMFLILLIIIGIQRILFRLRDKQI